MPARRELEEAMADIEAYWESVIGIEVGTTQVPLSKINRLHRAWKRFQEETNGVRVSA